MNESFNFRGNWKVILTIVGITTLVTALVVSMFFKEKPRKPGNSGETADKDKQNDQDEDSQGRGENEIVLELSQKTYSEWIEVNPEIEYLLYIGGKSIPVLRSKRENNEFLWNDTSIIDGYEYAYVDMRYDEGCHNLIIYGHSSAKYETIFNRFTDLAFIKANTNIFVENSEGVKSFTVIAYCFVPDYGGDLKWNTPKYWSDLEFQGNLALAQKKSKIAVELMDFEDITDGITLVTCEQEDGKNTSKRIIIMGIPN